ncbi:MAG: hypothetical protein KF696_06690 [Planctomycetes bacterium]|nr:hypothetical protein [Planctomycetota bacterium]MCW8137188.1 hypothetical protein [Planctomycetota bacterium]
MRALLIALLMVPAALAAADIEFKPLQCTPTGSNLSPSGWQVQWDKPAIEVKHLEVYVLAQAWPVAPSIDERCPKWRELLFADEFDAKGFVKAGGPELERTRIAVDTARVPMAVIDRRDEYRMVNVHVLFIDEQGKRHLPANMKAELIETDHVRADAYYMPTYFPYFTSNRIYAREAGVKLAWKLPELGGGPYEIEKLLFVGMEKSLPSMWVARMEKGYDDWIAGKDENSKPMVQELAKDATGCWIKDLNFQHYVIFAQTKSGLKFIVKPTLQGNRFEAPATEEDKKTLPAIELKAKTE